MTKKNYAAWHINPNEYSEDWSDIEKLHFFARYAVLAPSAHNTQPWHFGYDHNTLLLKASSSRELSYSGSAAHEPYISLGACLGTLEMTARGFGQTLKIDYVLSKGIVARVSIGKAMPPQPQLLQAITSRTSNRKPFNIAPLSPQTLDAVVDHPLKQASVTVVTSREDIEFLATKTLEATLTVMRDKHFRSELSNWVRNNLTSKHDGMPAFAQEMPTPPSLVAKHIIKNFDISKDQAKKDSARVRASAGLVIVAAKDTSAQSSLDAGRLYARVCLQAQLHGIASSGVGAAAVNPDSKHALKKRFGIDWSPVAIIRLGKASHTVRHTPRWLLKDVSDPWPPVV